MPKVQKDKDISAGMIYKGDCLEIMRQIPDDTIDLVFGSPPYESQREYDEVQFNLKGQDWVDWMVEVFMESLRICKGYVAFVVGHGVTKNYKWSATPALLIADLHRKGVCLRDPKWYRRVGIPGSGGTDDMRKDLEFIVCATRLQGELVWSRNLACGQKFKYTTGGAVSYRKKSGERTKQKRKQFAAKVANPGNVIDCAVGGGRMGSNISHENEAPFPDKLPNFFIRSYCKPNGIVLDPFSGSGTTVAEALKLGRLFIGIDIRKSQVELTKRRLKQVSRMKGLGLTNE